MEVARGKFLSDPGKIFFGRAVPKVRAVAPAREVAEKDFAYPFVVARRRSWLVMPYSRRR